MVAATQSMDALDPVDTDASHRRVREWHSKLSP